MRVLVTGGAGYIGSVVCRELLAAGYQVLVLDNLVTGHRAHVTTDFIQCDLNNREELFDLLSGQKIDAVMHFASATLVGESVEKPFKYLRENVTAALNLVEYCQINNIKRFVFSSTANLFEAEGDKSISEDAEIRPGSPYGEAKYIVERCLEWTRKLYGINYACFRYFNACGAIPNLGEDHDPETHLIPIVLDVALGKRDSIKVFGSDYPTPDGTCIRDYVHVKDLAAAHIKALAKLEKESFKYNLGNGKGFSVLEVIKAAEQITGKSIKYELTSRRAGDPAVLVADSTKAKTELGWQPEFTEITDIIASAWEWHRQRFSK